VSTPMRRMIGGLGSSSPSLPLTTADAAPGFFKTNKLRIAAVAVLVLLAFVVLYNMTNVSSGSYTSGKSRGGFISTSPRDSYAIGVIADLDQNSKDGERWKSFFIRGMLSHKGDGTWDVSFEAPTTIMGEYNEKGRGMELSELVHFQDMMLTCDDRTGIIYELVNERKVIPRFILPGGDGGVEKGFKCEWMTVKDDQLIVGSTGKEWTTPTGEVLNHDPTWIKIIDPSGRVTASEWMHAYSKMRQVTETEFPGYLIHEAVTWNPMTRKWYILPRRVSKEVYNDELDERRGSNVVIVANEDLNVMERHYVGDLIPSHGFSSVKFLPGRYDTLVALKSEEESGRTATYIMMFNVDGRILLPETKIGDLKLEGLEILPR